MENNTEFGQTGHTWFFRKDNYRLRSATWK